MEMKPDPVSIVLATLNGGAFLGEQLRSIQRQDHQVWHLILSDDGSTDDTLAITRATIKANQLQILSGPKIGLTQNFWHGLMQVPYGHHAAFCDQDDVWRADKLSRALDHLGKINGPALYTSGRQVTSHDLTPLYTQCRRPVGSLMHLLFRNTAAGHTCVLNPEAVQVLRTFPPPRSIPFHDWWAALVLKGVGARFIHDPSPTVLYRQHSSNVLGAKSGRMKAVMNGTYAHWMQSNFSALWDVQTRLTPSAQQTLRNCLPLRAGLSLGQTQTRMAHVRDHQQ